MAVQLAAAMGAEVTVLSRSKQKEEEAKRIGKGILVSTDEDAMNAAATSFDLIIDTVPVEHDVTLYTPLLDVDATLVIFGQVGPMKEFMTVSMIMGSRRVAGSLIGGVKQTQEVLDFCAEHNIHPICEIIRPEQINEAFEVMEKGDIAHRYIMKMTDMADNA